MKTLYIQYFGYLRKSSLVNLTFCFLLLTLVVSCQVLEPSDIENPNVTTGDFKGSTGAFHAWTNGARATAAVAVSRFCEYNELLSDNYYNNYTRSSKTFDRLDFSYRSGDVSILATAVGSMEQAAETGINEIAGGTADELFTLHYLRAYAHILGGENFTAMPLTARAQPVEWRTLLTTAVGELQTADGIATTAQQHALVYTLIARCHHRLGNKTEARAAAQQALQYDPLALTRLTFDGKNGTASTVNEYIGSYMFQPLPRLDFLDPKYTYSDYWDQPITISKAEECHLILAEADIADDDLQSARQHLHDLLALIAQRPTIQYLDKYDDRVNGGSVYPNGTQWLVKAAPDEPARAGLVRKHVKEDATHPADPADAYTLSTISGTSVTADMIETATTPEALLEMVYLMRQEVFFAEGRRVADLGLRYPLTEVEAKQWGGALPDSFTQPVIPPYIPAAGDYDKFDIDEATNTVTIHYNMNRVLVSNHATAFEK